MNLGLSPCVIISGEKLNSLVRRSIVRVAQYIDCLDDTDCYSTYSSITAGSQSDSIKAYFKKFLLYGGEAGLRIYDSEWVVAAFRYWMRDESYHVLEALLGSDLKDYKKSGSKSLRKGIWLLLMALHTAKAVVFPFSCRCYAVQRADKRGYGAEFYSELACFTLSALSGADEGFWANIVRSRRTSVASYGTKMILAMGVTTPEEITLSMVAEAYEAYFYSEDYVSGHFPVYVIFEYLIRKFGKRIPFTFDDLVCRVDEIKKNKNGVIQKKSDLRNSRFPPSDSRKKNTAYESILG